MANVVLLMSDEHNPRYSSPYGHPYVHTPHMQQLADSGTVYENAYCPSPLCLPSRSSFMAGRWVHQIQTYSNCNLGMEDFSYPSYGGVLAAQGVHTVHAGKVDVYRPGIELGFSEMLRPQDRAAPGDTNHGRTPLSIRQDGAARAGRYGPNQDPFAADTSIVDSAVTWLHKTSQAISSPWILSVNIHKPHFPQYVTQELWDMYPLGGDLPEHGPECASADHPYARDLRDHFQTDQFSEQHVRGLRRGYLGCVTSVDRQLGRLMRALQETGQLETTNIIYSTDHGDMLGKFGMWWKCSLYEDSVRVPLIGSGPDFEQGLRVRTPASLLDLQASLFHCVGARRPEAWRGQALQSLAQNDPDRPLFAEYHGHGTRSGAFMIRKGDWKLVHNMAAPHQLYNLAADPEELVNLADQKPDKIAELENDLGAICSPEQENQRAHDFERRQMTLIKGSARRA